MKPSRLAMLSLAGMMASSLTVYAVTDPSTGAAAIQERVGTALAPVATEHVPPPAVPRLKSEGTLALDARLGHAAVQERTQAGTFLLLDVRAGAGAPSARQPVHMALVIDRSGSMKGDRIARAIEAAQGMVTRLQDGDRVTAIAFDTATTAVVPTTVLDGAARARVNEALGAIQLGGDTCVSCGLEHALGAIERTRANSAELQRVVLLSDGQTNNGIRDVDGFLRLAEGARMSDVAISTVGLGLDYNERVLSAVALASNGMHHFVEDARSLSDVLSAETQRALTTVAASAEAVIRLAPGVRLARLFDRAFRREGDDIVVPLGALAPNDERSVLVELSLDGQQAGAHEIAHVRLRYRDVSSGRDADAAGWLGLMAGAAASQLDPLVAERVQRSLTTAALNDANLLLNSGNALGARERLARRVDELRTSASANAPLAGGDSRVSTRFDSQIQSAERALAASKSASAPRAKPADVQRAPRSVANDAFTNSL